MPESMSRPWQVSVSSIADNCTYESRKSQARCPCSAGVLTSGADAALILCRPTDRSWSWCGLPA